MLWSLFATALVALSVKANAQVAFQDVSEDAGLTGYTESWGAAIGDLNGDNCLDIFVQGHRDYPRVYRNTCTGEFEDIAYEMDDGTWIELPTDDKHGASFGDYDNDGDEDIFIGVSVTGDGQLWVNQGNGNWSERARTLGVTSDFAARVAGFADFNRDGKLDTFQLGLDPRSYFRYQNSIGSFSTLNGTGQACSTGDMNYGHFMDIDDNGTLEFICVQRGVWPFLAYDFSTLPWTDVTAQLPSLGNVNSTIIGDFDRNLRYDVLMIRGATRPTGAAFANDAHTRVESWIARNPGDPANYGFNFQTAGSITMTVWNRELSRNASPFVVNIAPGTSGCTSPTAEYRVCTTYNGGQNRYETNLPTEGQAYIVIQSTQTITSLNEVALGNRDLPIAPRLYMNTAGGFTYTAAGLNVPINCGGGAAADFDNDMDVDLYLTCGRGPENIRNRMFINQGNGTFVEQLGSGAEGPTGVGVEIGVAENAVTIDYDLDGFLDLFVTNGLLFYPWGKGGPDTLLHNAGNSNHWLQIKLRGVTSNRDGMGAKVYVTANGVTQLREQDGGYTRWAQNQQWLHFGLGANQTADVQVRWPSGQVSNYSGVAADRLYVATEGGGIAPAGYGAPVYTTLNPGDECGEPPYDLDFGPATFLWRDCGTDNWHFRAKGGRIESDPLRMQGTITGSAAFSGVTGVGLAGGDSATANPATRVNFSVGVRYTQDKGFDFSTTGQSSACLTFTREDIRHFIVGAKGKRITKPLNLVTLVGCGEAPPVDLSVGDASANEDSGSLSFVVSLSQASAQAVTFTASTLDGTATVAGNDYVSRNAVPFSIPAGSLSTVVTVQVNPDAAAEPDETLQLLVSNLSSNARFAKDRGLGTIVNDDGALPQLSISDGSAFEDTGAIVLTVSLDKIAADNVTFTVTTQGQTASYLSGDYTAIINQPYTIPAGSLSTTITIVVGVDNIVEPDEFLFVNLTNISSNVTVLDASGTATILNDDNGLPNLSIADAVANEDSGTLSFVVSLNQAALTPVTFTASTADGTATVANGDYVALVAQPGTIPAGSLSTNVVVALGADTAVEPNETFTVTLAGVSANVNVVDGAAIGTIVNDDVTPSGISIADASGNENGGPLAFTVSLDQVAAADVTFTVSTTDGTATVADADYTALASQPGVIPAGSLSTTVQVTLGNDNKVEPDETFTVTLAGVSANANVVDGSALGTIVNDDVDGPVSRPVDGWLGHAGPVTTNANRITYAGPTSGWNSTVYSVPLADLGFSDAFEVRFTIQGSQAGTLWVAGLGVTEGGSDFRDVDFGFRGSNGQLSVYENGTWRTNGPALASGDVVSLFVSGGTIEYRHNGAPVYSSTYAGTPAFYVDTAFKSGTVVLDVTVYGESAGPVDPPASQPIVSWLNPSGGVTASGNGIAHSGTPNNWTNSVNSVALSTMGAGDSYTVSWTIDSDPAGSTWVVGLGVNETGPERTDIEYGLRSSNGALDARQGGTWLANAGTLAVGDTLAIRVTGTLLEYQRNGVTFYSLTIAGTEDFYVDTAFKNGAIQLGNFTLTN